MILAVCDVFFLNCRCLLTSKIKEVDSPVALVVEVFGVVKHETVAHVCTKVLPIEIVVPDPAAFRYHEETQKLIAQDHLYFLIKSAVVIWGIRVRGTFLVHFGPFHPSCAEFVN